MAARGAALDILRAVRTGDSFDRALARPLHQLSPADRRLAHEIASGVLRSRRDLDRQIRPLVSIRWRRLSPDVRDLLRLGAYQLKGLSRVPPYAAVQSTVEVAKGLGRPGSARLINAVLRSLTRIGTAEAPTGATAPDMSLRYSHPEWLVARWLEQHGADATRALLEHNNRQPPLVLQPTGWSLDELRGAVRGAGFATHDATQGAGLVVSGGGIKIAELPGYREGGFVVQDPAQALTLRYAKFPEGQLVWDACAAPGGKAALLSRRGPVVASDRSRARLARLRDTVGRAAPEVRLFLADARQPPIRAGALSWALLDAPCTATGVLARHPDARWRLASRRIASLASLQERLLDGAAPSLAVGGVLVYATCSIEPEENAIQIDRFLDRHPEFERIEADFFLFPPVSETDGAFAARLRRVS